MLQRIQMGKTAENIDLLSFEVKGIFLGRDLVRVFSIAIKRMKPRGPRCYNTLASRILKGFSFRLLHIILMSIRKQSDSDDFFSYYKTVITRLCQCIDGIFFAFMFNPQKQQTYENK